jgi:hypothetical protein
MFATIIIIENEIQGGGVIEAVLIVRRQAVEGGVEVSMGMLSGRYCGWRRELRSKGMMLEERGVKMSIVRGVRIGLGIEEGICEVMVVVLVWVLGLWKEEARHGIERG